MRLAAILVILMQLWLGFYHANVSISVLPSDNAMVNSSIIKYSTSNGSVSLPAIQMFHDTGIILFYHIPKTGGTTIRNNLQQHKNVTVFRAFRHKDITTMNQLVEPILNKTRKQLLFVELHGKVSGLPYLHEQLQNWRRRAIQQNIPIFAFTLLREPVAFHVSYFVHFHHLRCRWNWCEHQLYNTSRVDQLLQHALQPDHQCQILWYGQRENKRRSVPPPPVSEKQCQRIQDNYLANDWDWVGTTEQLQTVTLPLLTHMLFRNATMGREMPAWNQQKDTKNKKAAPPIRVSDLNETTKQMIRALSSWDVAMYNKYRHKERLLMQALRET